MKYIDADKLIAEIKHRIRLNKEMLEIDSRPSDWGRIQEGSYILRFIEHIQQEQPKGNLEYWLEHFGMPKENIDNCITQIVQGYGACRYLEGIQHGAEAVNELAKQEQPEVDLEKEIEKQIRSIFYDLDGIAIMGTSKYASVDDMEYVARHFFELGLKRKEGAK